MAYDKYQVKEALEPEDVFEILDALGAEPQMNDSSIICKTICHGGDSHKLYYYCEQKLFHCYTHCEPATFDIFELIQKTQQLDLNEAVFYVVNFFNLQYRLEEVDDASLQEDWKIMRKWQELSAIKINHEKLVLPEIDDSILWHYPQPHILDWEQDHISKEVCDYMGIKYDPVEGAIIIPHVDENGRLVGIRQRTLIQENEKWGKYRPWSKLEKQDSGKYKLRQFNHPLGFNLYGLYQAKPQIEKMEIAMVFESEKSVLAAMNYLGLKNNLAVAVCGSNLSKYQFDLLLDAGAKEICIGFDADYQKIGDENWERVVNRLQKIYSKYSAYARISFLFDTSGMLLGYKQSPTDAGQKVFMELWKNRVYLN